MPCGSSACGVLYASVALLVLVSSIGMGCVTCGSRHMGMLVQELACLHVNTTCIVEHAWHVHRHAKVGMWVQTVAGVGAWACHRAESGSGKGNSG